MIPISKDIVEPKIKTNILFVNSLEDFEKIELEPNENKGAFDNFKQCFYFRERDRFGEYSAVKIYFYEDFSQKVQNIEREDFIKKCKEAGLDEIKTEVAIKFFLENKKPQEVWLWVVENNIKDWSWDYVRTLKYRLKLKLYKNIIKK